MSRPRAAEHDKGTGIPPPSPLQATRVHKGVGPLALMDQPIKKKTVHAREPASSGA